MSGVLRATSADITTVNATDVNASNLFLPGMVVQVQTVRSDYRGYYGGNDTPLAVLAITITPKYSTSLLICQWYVSGEANEDVVLRVQKDGSTPPDGYNTEAGNVAWSGIVAWEYDRNQSSTPGQRVVNYFDAPGNTIPHTYVPSVRDSSTGSDGIYLNRTFNSTGANAYEATVSFGMIWEIYQ